MGGNTLYLTVLFEQPFWIGILERSGEGRYEACKVSFGAEPRDAEVYDFLLRNYSRLVFSPAIRQPEMPERSINPKRALREARKALESAAGIGTRAQQALQLQREQNRQEREVRTRRQREAEEKRRFDLRQEKRREKHRGH